MKDALPRSCLKVVVLYSLLLCALPPLLNTPAWPQAVAEAQDAKSSIKFAPPVLSYASVFKNYHSYRKEEVASWREANDTVGRIGGWRYYLEEAAQSESSAPPAPLPISHSDESDTHSGHGGKP